ncbi:protein-glutamine gamma-glutamyltransferase E-like [Leuresthes tenuis]|uniref:protein-glutamine gamma-glutamyltransferase E-like n=1 Tax=Leuresthes tenuis TaxID=355514 RepID=UPI003B50A937
MAFFRGVDLHTWTNNREHNTHEITWNQLIVRRGQPFKLTLTLTEPFSPDLHPLTLTAVTGKYPSEAMGTMSRFGIPDEVQRSPSAKAVWKAELVRSSSPQTGILTLSITPSADSPIGEYKLSGKHRGEEKVLASLVVLFNPWCPEDSVFLSNEEQKQEYVMNEQGIIYRGSANYISGMNWDYGQFEEDMVDICLKILDVSNEHQRDPAEDVAARSDPKYVGRVLSAMINSSDDRGVLQGNWGSSFWGGVPPTRWSGSYAILKRWYESNCRTVKYGQCWVFAGVMCSVMRLLGIPCRVISNFQSAHDTNGNLTIDSYYSEEGFRELNARDSVWNFHVWVEGWMKRPDLAGDGKYDGWQVLDPTPQETSDGVYRCGPASVSAILNGDTHLKYDVPFVFAEVNADRITWLVKTDGSKVKVYSDPSAIGQNTSTKSVGSNKRLDVTNTYKYREGSLLERLVFQYALAVNESGPMEAYNTRELVMNGSSEPVMNNASEPVMNGSSEPVMNGSSEPMMNGFPPAPKLTMRFEEVSEPLNGEDVKLKLVLSCDCSYPRLLSVNISVQAMRYNGSPVGNIQNEVTEQKLQPGKDLSIPIVVPFSKYHKYMMQSESMNISALVTDKENPGNVFLAENCVVLKDPPVSVTVSGPCRVNQESYAEVVFMNPLNKILTDCSVTISGSGLFKGDTLFELPNLRPNVRVCAKIFFVPYKSGERTLNISFDSSSFRDIKDSCTVTVEP